MDRLEARKTMVGKFLQAKRIAAKMSQAQVAEALNYTTPQFISNWERGVAMPPKDNLPVLCALYEIKPKALIDLMARCEDTCYRRELQDAFRAS